MLFAVTWAKIPPYCRMEQYQEWEQLKPSGEHIKHKNIFGQGIEAGKVLCRTHQLKAGTDIVDGSCNCRKIGYQILAL